MGVYKEPSANGYFLRTNKIMKNKKVSMSSEEWNKIAI